MRHVREIYDIFRKNYPREAKKVAKYYGEMSSTDKNESYERFRNSDVIVMLATKAFGMGINIGDIMNVYHYSVTGTLADYTQEIGRAARKLDVGFAVSDYFKSDTKHVRMLWGLSGIRHYQLREMAKKIYSLYKDKYSDKGGKNLLLSPETFSYIFNNSLSIDNKVKSGLLLLSNDLLNLFHFRVLNVSARNLFSTQYIIVPYDVEKVFLQEFGSYCTLMNDNYTQKILRGNNIITESKMGNVFSIDLASLWENRFRDMTFSQFKYKFFQSELFDVTKFAGNNGRIVPNMKIIITYNDSYEKIKSKFMAAASAIQDTFNDIKQKFGGKNFKLSDFINAFRQRSELEIKREYMKIILELFCYSHVDSSAGGFYSPSEKWKFIEYRNDEEYCIRGPKYSYIGSNLRHYFIQAEPNHNGKYIAYLSMPKKEAAAPYQQLMTSLLQIINMASYEIIGGHNLQIFLRINDPSKLLQISENNHYRNNILSDIENRHNRAICIIDSFMSKDFNDIERWEIIEQYFLDSVVK